MDHTHTCRRCGDGIDCDEPETGGGCPAFDGYCPDCNRFLVEFDDAMRLHRERTAPPGIGA